jgi:hypothetical protein
MAATADAGRRLTGNDYTHHCPHVTGIASQR